jgi:PPK2 family polyphosphate:nucleotide phosphotransferase
MSNREDLRADLRLPQRDGFTLASVDPGGTPRDVGKKESKSQLEEELADELFDLHEMMMAAEEQALLLILQGTDASGKSGTIKHVVRRVNPVGVRVAGFVEPDAEEERHHFLWRIREELPPLGHLGAFDRSHYEDLVVPVVEGEIDENQLENRIGEVRDFEQELVDGGTVIVKCYLHLSYDEQRERFLRRLRREDKRWKFNPSDMEARRQWDDYQAAYANAIAATDTDDAPWYIIPADHKWYRNWAIARLLISTMRSMGVGYPQPDLDLDSLRSELAPPG